MKKILITGSCGFIGKNLKELFKNEYKIFAPNSKQLDLTDSQKVLNYLKKNKFSVVIHSAVYMVTRNSKKDPSLELRNNLRMFFNIVRGRKHFKRMFYFGSGAEYDMQNYKKKMKEEYFDKHVPVDDYGFTKYIAAKYIQNIDNVFDLRLFGVFGKYEDWEIRFISNAICKTLFNMNITLEQNVYFDYLYIKDLGEIIKKLINVKRIPYKHINVCTGRPTTLLNLANIVKHISGKRIKIKVKKKGLKQEYSGDNKKLLQMIGKFKFTPKEDAIKELYLWYKINKKLIDRKKLLFDK
jgi:GDP-L-fucose synthase